MITKLYGHYYGVCDVCYDKTEPCESYNEALKALKINGFKFKFENHEWTHACPECRKQIIK